MATFTKTFGTAPPRDAFYPNVLTPDLQLDAGKVQDAFRRTFDFLYKINPPVGSRISSSVLSTYNFVPTFTINLNNNMFLLDGENWNSSTAGVSWNAHTLTYHGKQYSIAAGGPTTNKFIYWSLDNANIYQSSATFPALNFVDVTDNSVAAGLVAVWNSSDGKLYPFWSAKLAPAFISTALIENAAITTALIANLAVTNAKINDLAADKISTGTLAASVEITLTQSDTTPSKLRWQNTAQAYANTTNNVLIFGPNTDKTNFIYIGSDVASNVLRWRSISVIAHHATAGTLDLAAGDDVNGVKTVEINLSSATKTMAFFSGGFEIDFINSNVLPATANQISLGSPSLYWLSVVSASLTAQTGSFKVATSGQGITTTGLSPNTAIAFTNADIEDFVGATKVFQTTASSSTTLTNIWLLKNGVLTNVTIDASGFLKV